MRTVGVLFVLCVGAVAAAQPRTSETIEVSIVNLDVVVTDKQSIAVQVDENVDALSVGVADETAKEFGVKRIAMPKRIDATASRP